MIQLLNIQKKYHEQTILNGLQMAFEDHAITAILGPSGCGKTTLLKIVAGLIPADAGEISGMEGRIPGFLFQEPRLLPWMNAMQNLDFVLPRAMDKNDRRRLCNEMLDAVGLAGYQNHYPSQLSGGMSQRLSIARAFIIQSDILFMDEPFQSLDIKRREQVFGLFRELWQKHRPTVLMVTHDVQEASFCRTRCTFSPTSQQASSRKFTTPCPSGNARFRTKYSTGWSSRSSTST